MNFYGFVDYFAGESSFSSTFYSTLDETILENVFSGIYGTVLEFDNSGSVPKVSANYDVTTIELYEVVSKLDEIADEKESVFESYTLETDDNEDMVVLVIDRSRS
jgi:hypothetical protein